MLKMANSSNIQSNSKNASCFEKVFSSRCPCWKRGRPYRRDAVDIVVIDTYNGRIHDADSGIVAVPNEMKREKSTGKLNESLNHPIDDNHITEFSNAIEPWSRAADSFSSIVNNTAVDGSQLSSLRSQLTKTRRENKRLTGELHALRTAYSSVQANLLHWKSQATLLLKRAQIFETQLRHCDSEVLANKPVAGTPTCSRCHAVLATGKGLSVSPHNNAISSPKSVLSENPSESLVRLAIVQGNSVDMRNVLQFGKAPDVNVAVFVLSFDENSAEVVDNFMKSAHFVTELRQKLAFLNSRCTVLTLRYFMLPLCPLSGFTEQVPLFFEKYNAVPKLCLWLVDQKSNEKIVDLQLSSDFNVRICYDAVQRANCGDIEFTVCDDDLAGKIEAVRKRCHQREQHSSTINYFAAAAGHFTCAGHTIEPPVVNCFHLSWELPSDAFYLSQLHLNLHGRIDNARRLPVVIAGLDSLRLLALMNQWITSLMSKHVSTQSNYHIAVADINATNLSASALFELTIHQLIRSLRPYTGVVRLIFGNISNASQERLSAEFWNILSQVASNIGIIIAIRLGNLDSVNKTVFSKLYAFFMKPLPANCRVFIFVASPVEEFTNDYDRLLDQVDGTSELSYNSRCSSDNSIFSNLIRIMPLDMADCLVFAKTVISSVGYSVDRNSLDELEKKVVAWLQSTQPVSVLSLEAVNLSVRYFSHTKFIHGENEAHSGIISVGNVLKHFLGGCCSEVTNVAAFIDFTCFTALSICGFLVEDALSLIPELDLDLWERFVSLATLLGLVVCDNNNDLEAEPPAALAITYRVRIRQRKECLAVLDEMRDCSKGLAWYRRELQEFYCRKLATKNGISSDAVFGLLSLLLDTQHCAILSDCHLLEKSQQALVTDPVALHLLYCSGNLPWLSFLHVIDDDSGEENDVAVTADVLGGCRKLVLLSDLRLPADINRAQLLLSLAGIAADCNFINMATGFIADAVESIRADGDENAISSWILLVLCHLKLADMSCQMLLDEKMANTSSIAGHRATAERNLANAVKLITRQSLKKMSGSNEEDLLKFASNEFLSYISSASRKLQETSVTRTANELLNR